MQSRCRQILASRGRLHAALLLLGCSGVVAFAPAATPLVLGAKSSAFLKRQASTVGWASVRQYSRRPIAGVHMKRGYADGPLGQVHFHDTGGEGPPLLLLPMAPTSGKAFDVILPHFAAAGLRAIAVDPPGTGGSDAPPNPTTIEDWTAASLAVLDHIGIPQCDVVGCKTGAKSATDMAVRYPERVRKVVLVNALLFSEEEMRDKQAKFNDGSAAKALEWMDAGDSLDRWFNLQNKYMNDPALASWTAADILLGRAPTSWTFLATGLYDQRAGLESMTQPTLLLLNRECPFYKQALPCQDVRPDFEVAELAAKPGSTHLWLDAPEAMVAAVDAFLRK